MSSIWENAALAALGALSITKERAEKLYKELVKEGKMSKSDAAKFTKEMLARIEKGRKELSRVAKKTVKDMVCELDIPTRTEFRELKKKVEGLARKK
jgi:polyhydroxyalkanoate synthesis regulator phasin